MLVFPLFAMASERSSVALLFADVLVGVVLGMLVISAHLSERFAPEVRATGIAVTYGLATAIIGGTAPLVGSLLAQRGVPLGIPAYLAALGAAGLLAAARESGTAPLGVRTAGSGGGNSDVTRTAREGLQPRQLTCAD